jgi:hypothetical protein
MQCENVNPHRAMHENVRTAVGHRSILFGDALCERSGDAEGCKDSDVVEDQDQCR